MKLFYLSVALLFVVTGCGNSLTASTELSTDQKARLKDVITASARGPLAGGAASMPGQVFSAVEPSKDETTIQMANKLRDAINEGRCNRKWNQEGTNGANLEKGQSRLLEYSLDGGTCPVNLQVNLKSSYSNDGTDLRYSTNIRYAANDADFKALNDVTDWNMDGEFRIKFETTSIRSEGTVRGQLRSTKYGTVDLELFNDVSGDLTKSTQTTRAIFKFSDFTADLQIVETYQSGVNTKLYSINGQAVSDTEFYSYVSGNSFIFPTAKK